MTTSPEKPWQSLAGQTVLVTGASGFIGSHLVRRLLGEGVRVAALLRSPEPWRLKDILEQITVIPGDLSATNTSDLRSLLADVKVIFHLAAAGVDPAKEDAATIIETNVTGTLKALQLARELEVDRFIYCGSCSEYTPGACLPEDASCVPTSEYAAAKSAGWMLTQAFTARYGLPAVSLRPFTVYGPFEASYRLIPYTVINCLQGADMKLTGGEQTRDFVFIDDAVDAFLLAGTCPDILGATFNICSGAATPIKEVVSTVAALTGSGSKPQFGALPYLDTETWTLYGDPAQAEARLGWKAKTPLTEGLEKTIGWFRKNTGRYAEYNRAG